ncbi:fatty acid-binding protein 2, liver-like [Acanthaster planci]|uniref:Fatty acid-binding protein 2, liver-like n=1 Tax=Acanthaster planci TaxID=133434 RepID=A0A8B7ZYI8_ACAPL|nr:fatty acid-binding protein 2, liver-like [Acanthaster planci]
MPCDLSGKWVYTSGEGMVALMDKLNIPADKRPSDPSSTVEITQNGDNFCIKTTTPDGRSREAKFTIGVEFVDEEIKALRGMDIKATPCWEGDKLVLKGSGGNGSVSRQIVGGQMVLTYDVMGVKATRVFNKA